MHEGCPVRSRLYWWTRAIADGNTDLEILVDNEVARENVTRLINRRGLKADARQEGPDIMIRTAKL